MKRLFIGLMVLSLALASCEEFLDEYSTIGLSADKLTDINAMNSLNAGAYNDMRGFYAYQHMITTTLMRDVQIRRSANWTPFFKWTSSGIPGMFTENSYSNGFRALNRSIQCSTLILIICTEPMLKKQVQKETLIS